uniref:NS2 n=1 Tax=Parvoviridae sp. TaxID=1940570 RepID=A0A893A8G2_9VIRU|nr:MAG: hypothetical protein 2 [Parvoviridae sp.]
MSETNENPDYLSEEETELTEDTTKIQFPAILNRILTSYLPLSQEHPGYLIGFAKYLETQDHLNPQLENCLVGLIKAGRLWKNATPNRLKKGVIEYIENSKSLMGNSLETSIDFKAMKSLRSLLESYKEMDITAEDCSNYVTMETTSTSRTTATSVTGRAGAIGLSKRKHTDSTLEEINVDLDEITVEVEPSPTFKTYSSITLRKEGNFFTRKLEDSWKTYMMKVTLYKKEDLMNCQGSRQKWDHRFMEMEINFNKGDAFSTMMSQIRNLQEEYLREKNVNWAPVKRFRYE